MTAPILVTGGTGTLGRLVVRRLRDAGSNVRVLSRHSREAEDGIQFVSGDLATGEGSEAAVEGAEIIVHCAGTPKGNEDETRNLVRAASRAGARHLVYISVVGADRVPVVSGVDRAMFGYFALISQEYLGIPLEVRRVTGGDASLSEFVEVVVDGGRLVHGPDSGDRVPVRQVLFESDEVPHRADDRQARDIDVLALGLQPGDQIFFQQSEQHNARRFLDLMRRMTAIGGNLSAAVQRLA